MNQIRGAYVPSKSAPDEIQITEFFCGQKYNCLTLAEQISKLEHFIQTHLEYYKN